MSETHKYYWLKLNKDFFNSKRIKKLRKLAGGDTYTIIYLKMQLLSLTKDGYLEYTGLEKTFPEELALDIDEDPENVAVTVSYLLKCGLLIEENQKDYRLPFVQDSIIVKTSSALRSEAFRDRQKMLQTNKNEQKPNVDIDIDIDKEIDKEKEIKKKKPQPTEPKKTFGSYKNVRLTDSQLQKLNIDYGEAKTSQAIEFLSGYRQEKGYKSKEDYLSLKRWIYKALDEHSGKRKPLEVSDNKRDYDFDAIERGLIN